MIQPLISVEQVLWMLLKKLRTLAHEKLLNLQTFQRKY